VNCRFCAKPLEHSFLDLGFAPLSNGYLTEADLRAPERYFPLRLYVCDGCWLVQTEDFARADELFRADYAYFTSTARSALDHAAAYCTMARERFRLDGNSFVVEVGSNDGYLLRNFVRDGVSCLGIEPTAGTAAAAEALGVPVLREFFGEAIGRRLADEGRQADLLIGNNVYAHVPDINDFTAGLREALKPRGTITLEFPHLLRLIEETQFDTVYHEHFSYLSLWTVQRIFASCGLRVWDVEHLAIHGGSLRVYGCHAADPRRESPAVLGVLREEESAGLWGLEIYSGFQPRVDKVKDDLLVFLIEQKRAGKSVAAYGAAAKGNTLFNYAGVKPDLVPFVCDAAPSKQGKYLPGSHIPVLAPSALQERRPDWVLVLPWNIINEVTEQQRHIRNWGGRFVVAVPRLKLLP
jgi:SAM-dependent methyltransferase